MTEQKSVSPLLDGFTLGTPVNDHFGVCCYPAVKENSDRKYIVKMISVPASQTQLDALLITGAYKDPADAAEYFREVSDRIVQEAEFLKTMSRLEGFIPYEGIQVEPMSKNRLGYEVYLVSGFRLSLERYMHRHTITHLDAVNLGIDLCAALAACRRAGMLYIDLKPANVFISTKKDYKIGDLGFAALDSLKWNSMPEKYRSPYTAPELHDDMNSLNATADTYAAGMILYQIFNNGALPETEDPTAPLPAPANADEEIAQIILKACAPEVENRWESPVEMGQALVAYMQSGTVNDTPLMEPLTGSALGAAAEYATAKFPIAEIPQNAPAEAVPAETAASEDVAESQDAPMEESDEEAPVEEAPVSAEEAEISVEEAVTEADDVSAEAEIPEPQEKEPENLESDMEAAAAAEFAAIAAELTAAEEEPLPAGEHLDKELNELNNMLRPKPAPKKAPKEHPNITPVVVEPPKKRKSPVKFLLTLLLFLLLAAGAVFGYYFYQTEYLQTVRGISVSGAQNSMTVTVDSSIDENLLTVVCTDTYGHSSRQRVRGGQATFTQLNPDSLYKVQLEISGLHKLVGPVSDIYTTESVTNVVSFLAAVGAEDGSVILNLTVDGHEPNQWQIIYSAEGEPELGHTFTGHTASINNLVLGKEYTFRLETGNHEAVDGMTSLNFTAGRVVTAKNLSVVSCVGGKMVVRWDAPEGTNIESWRVHCSGEGYDHTVESTEKTAAFDNIDTSKPYTVEVTAKGMTQSARVSISANPVTVTKFTVTESDAMTLNVSWDFEGAAPDGGWMLMYTLDAADLPSVVTCTGASAVVAPRIPGAVYHFSIQATNDVSVFNSAHTYSSSAAKPFTEHGVQPGQLTAKLLPRPENAEWTYYSTPATAYSDSFALGQSVSMVLSTWSDFYLNEGDVHILYVYRDAAGNALAEAVSEADFVWRDLWIREDYHQAELDIPTAPTRTGPYTLDIYFNGASVATVGLSVY